MDESVRKPTDLLGLTEALPGAVPYMTLQLAAGLEMHYRPDSPDAPNDVATALASRLGYEGAHINGAVHFTGESGESDDALGMDDETHCALYEELAEALSAPAEADGMLVSGTRSPAPPFSLGPTAGGWRWASATAIVRSHACSRGWSGRPSSRPKPQSSWNSATPTTDPWSSATTTSWPSGL
ncbi:hypothetical protein [Streptomyces sp. NRRL S-1824]|uniref:hypothetical protein n=1 Tax=Streptomyces sp. NRRL S-1824 TaxID=1463889 RepID=UPI00131C55FB|nr:hypothetical protein [Streptomyces sp. NRRL S-1824]